MPVECGLSPFGAAESSTQGRESLEGRVRLRILLGVVALAGLKGVELPVESGNALEEAVSEINFLMFVQLLKSLVRSCYAKSDSPMAAEISGW